MRINGKPFVILLVLVTIALCFTMLWLWKRLSRRTPGAILGRIALVLGSQLAITATILAVVNIYFGFYTSWQDLVGGGPQSFQLHVQPPPSIEPADAAQIAAQTPNGEPQHMHGLRSGISADLTIFTPAGYQDPHQAHTRYPVIVVDNTGPPGSGGVIMGRFVTKGTNEVPALIVVVSTGGAPSIPCIDIAGSPTGQGALFWDQDLRTAIATRYRTRLNAGDWGIVGGGANSQCAGTLAVLSAGYYSVGAALGAWTAPEYPPGSVPPATAVDPEQWLKLYPGPPSDLLLVNPDPATAAAFASNPGALRVSNESGLDADQVFTWVAQTLGQRGQI